jgi:hypothetical protein
MKLPRREFSMSCAAALVTMRARHAVDRDLEPCGWRSAPPIGG